jgi:predicted nucleic acid-binding protein
MTVGADGALPPAYLADTSALARFSLPAVRERIAPLLSAGLIARCGMVDLEMMFTARSHLELVAMRTDHADAFPFVPTTQADFERALDVMVLLSAPHKHRAAKAPDLLVAAVAERAGLTVLHYDADFEHIADVTGQAMEWVVPRGSLRS